MSVKMRNNYIKWCCICKNKIRNIHDTHNAQPVQEDICCSLCNQYIVIPKRIEMVESNK